MSAATFRNAWESVTTSAGGFASRASASRSSRSWTTSAIDSPSSRSRIAITCGRISRPLGASLSIGTTRTATSPGGTRSATSRRLSKKSAGASRRMRLAQVRRARRRSAPNGHGRHALAAGVAPGLGVAARPQVRLVEDDDAPAAPRRRARRGAAPRTRPRRRLPRRGCRCPRGPGPPASARCAARPSAPSSSMPAVSTNSTGPERQQLHRLLHRIGGGARRSPTRSTPAGA